MSQVVSFRASTALIVGAYAAIVGTLVIVAGSGLVDSVGSLSPQTSWLMADTTQLRMSALRAAGRPETAALYGLTATLSWALIAALTSGGFVWGALNKGDTVIGVDKALSYLAALAGLYALATTTEVLLHKFHLDAPQGGLHTIPALWFATMIPSAAILARVGSLIAHDVGALLAIALEGEPQRLAALIATTEERRGAASLEARLARSMARLRGRL